jgi:hypothetical protein
MHRRRLCEYSVRYKGVERSCDVDDHGPDREFASNTRPLRQVQRFGQPTELDEQGHRKLHGGLRPLRLQAPVARQADSVDLEKTFRHRQARQADRFGSGG